MAAFARTEQDVLGLARADGQAAVQLFAVRDGKLVGRDVFLLEATARRSDDGGPGRLRGAVLRPRDDDPAAPPPAGRPGRRGRPARPSWPPGAAARSELAVPQRGEKRRLVELAARNAAETLAREQARWLADEGKTLAALEELAGALGLPGPPARIECYDIEHDPGPRDGREHGRLRGRPAADRRLPPLPDQGRRRPGRLRQPRGDAPAPAPARRRRARRGAPRSCAGPCPT